MRYTVYASRLLDLLKQRNLLLPLCTVLACSQLLSLVFLFCKKERVILIPPIVSQPMWIEERAVSSTYLEQMGLFIGQMLLSNTPTSVGLLRDTVLRYVHPGAYTQMRQQLIGEEAHLKKHQGSYHFHLNSVHVEPANHSVVLHGDRENYIGGKCVERARETYRLTFAFSKGRYLLTGCVKEEKA